MRALLWSVMVACALTNVSAAQSTALTYQGALKNGGVPADGLHDFRFRLFDAPAAGVQVGTTQCIDNLQVAEGVFIATLDFGNHFTTSAPRFIEIDVRRDTGLSCADVTGFVGLATRQLITAAPIATHAKSAFALDAPDGSPANAVFVDNDGKVGIGTVAPAVPLHVLAPNTGPTPGEGVRIQGALATGSNLAYMSFANGVGTAIGYVGDGGGSENNIYLGAYGADIGLVNSTFGTVLLAKSTGLVGIGTSAPAAKLDVRGDIRLGASGEYFAVRSPTNDRTIRGQINFNGTIDVARSSAGFTVTHNGTGVYTINFTTPYTSAPTVVVAAQAICCRARVTGTQTNTAFVHLLSYSGNELTDSPFHFIAVGPN
jgi:hypothetical protein